MVFNKIIQIKVQTSIGREEAHDQPRILLLLCLMLSFETIKPRKLTPTKKQKPGTTRALFFML